MLDESAEVSRSLVPGEQCDPISGYYHSHHKHQYQHHITLGKSTKYLENSQQPMSAQLRGCLMDE